jgi:hypothetical protein
VRGELSCDRMHIILRYNCGFCGYVYRLAGGDGNGKLGKVPKNQRLKDAMSQHRNARPKPKGWLLSVVEQVYKDGESCFVICG